MKIGLLSRWNATCGISIHAELIGKGFINLGHEIVVFAPYIRSANLWWHHKVIRKDEKFVHRCYYERDPKFTSNGWIDKNVILNADLDALIIESYQSIPHRDVEDLVKTIRKKGIPIILVIHEGSRSELTYSSLSIFDKIVVFDDRFIREVLPSNLNRNVHIVPYPCMPPIRRIEKPVRKSVKFFSFGRQPVNEYEDFVKALSIFEEEGKINFKYYVYRSNGYLPYGSFKWLVQVRKKLELNEVYKYLKMSDICLLPKGKTNRVVVSSTYCLIVGSLTPIIAPNTRHFEKLPLINGFKPIVLYNNVLDLKRKIYRLVYDDDFREGVIYAMRVYADKNSYIKIARKFLNIFS